MRKFFFILALFLIGIFFSYRLLEVPQGLTADEASFGYNGVLLSETGHDENGKFLPFFILGNEGKDWKQPVTQYYITLFFKIFGPSVFNLRLTSVLIIIVSAVLVFYLGKLMMGEIGAVLSTLIFLTTPLVMIQSHMALDNIAPIPFTILWIISLLLFQKTNSLKYLIIGGISLGIAFYSYKGMRIIVSVWCLLTLIYLGKDLIKDFSKINFINFIRYSLIFSLSILPFFAIIPILQKIYPGAVFGGQNPSIDSIYSFLYVYLSSFDPSFLFISGDATIWHSTGKHGMFLLATLPLFIVGCYQAIKKAGLWLFILGVFFTAPLLFGLVGSVHRASRLMAIIPLYCLISALGTIFVYQIKLKFTKIKLLFIGVMMLILLNYLDFINYYWFTYPKQSENAFGHIPIYLSYKVLSEQSKKLNLVPFISGDLEKSEGETGRFYEALYFKKLINKWYDNDVNPSPGSILLSAREQIPGLKRINFNMPYYYLHVSP